MSDSGGDSGVRAVKVEGQLVVAARSGSARAFAVLVDRHYAGLFVYLERLLGDRELAEDVAQETFFAAYRALRRLSDEHTFAGWLYRIARNKAVSAARRRALLRFVSLDGLGEIAGSLFGRGAEQSVEDVPTRHAVQAALGALPLGEREALLLHSVAGFPAREVAAILGISPDAAARRISRGSQRFRTLYRAANPAGEEGQWL